MSSGISANGVTLENIFDPYVAGTTQAAATGINGGGSDLNTQFAKLSYGTSAAATGIETGGADLNTIFAAKGTASYINPTPSYDWTSQVPEPGSSYYTINNAITWHSDGTWTTSVGQNGTWSSTTITGIGNGYQIMLDNFVLNNTAGQTLTLLSNDMASWITLSTNRSANMQLYSRPSSIGSTWTCRVQIRRVSDSMIVYTGTISGKLTVNNA